MAAAVSFIIFQSVSIAVESGPEGNIVEAEKKIIGATGNVGELRKKIFI